MSTPHWWQVQIWDHESSCWSSSPSMCRRMFVCSLQKHHSIAWIRANCDDPISTSAAWHHFSERAAEKNCTSFLLTDIFYPLRVMSSEHSILWRMFPRPTKLYEVFIHNMCYSFVKLYTGGNYMQEAYRTLENTKLCMAFIELIKCICWTGHFCPHTDSCPSCRPMLSPGLGLVKGIREDHYKKKTYWGKRDL